MTPSNVHQYFFSISPVIHDTTHRLLPVITLDNTKLSMPESVQRVGQTVVYMGLNCYNS